ncbi:MAG: polysaccharide biosynthesis/export family protein [Bacteroidales bacterium]|nr:polysaccharide biosynthesis/export family protein [Bacteroidales bacterium]
MNLRKLIIAGLTAVLALSSCASGKKFVYLNDMEAGKKYPFDYRHEAVIQCNDRLAITVSCKQPELALPFNIQTGSVQISSDGTARSSATLDNKGYRVDTDGNIDFPILGTIHLAGLNISEATELIKQQIIDGDYIKAPLVTIDFLNFKYTVLGAIGGNGSYTVNDGRITLIEAIANAGDLSSKARLDRIAVIRETDGSKEIFLNDIRSKDIFNSPCFFLQQNDIIYVEPKYKKKDREDKTLQYVTLATSLVTTVCSVIWAINSAK